MLPYVKRTSAYDTSNYNHLLAGGGVVKAVQLLVAPLIRGGSIWGQTQHETVESHVMNELPLGLAWLAIPKEPWVFLKNHSQCDRGLTTE